MPIQFPDFPNAWTSEQMGVPNLDIIGNMIKGQQFGQSRQLFPSQLQQQQVLAKYAEPNAMQELQKAILGNKKSQLENQYYAPNIQSEIASRDALTKKTNIMTPLEAEELRLKNHEYVPLTQAQINSYNMGGKGGLGVGGKEELTFQNYVNRDNPQLNNDPAKIYEASNRLRDGYDTLSDGTKLNPMSPASRESYNRIVGYGSTSQGRNQQRYAATLETMIQSADKNIGSATKYSDLLGAEKGSADKAIELLGGEGSPDYQAYNNFVNVDVPSMAGEYMRQLGVNASDEQKRLYKAVVNPIGWFKHPKTALSQWNYFKDLARKSAATIAKPQSEINQELRNPKSVSNAIKNSNKKNPKEMTTEEIKNELAGMSNG
jgi:hypothetical protein